jgi:hypothetical protein
MNYTPKYRQNRAEINNLIIPLPNIMTRIKAVIFPVYVIETVTDPILLMKMIASYCFRELDNKTLSNSIRNILKCRNAVVHGQQITEKMLFDLIQDLERFYNVFNEENKINLKKIKLTLQELKKIIGFNTICEPILANDNIITNKEKLNSDASVVNEINFDNIRNSNIDKGTIFSLREKYQNAIKYKPTELLDGFYQYRRGQIVKFNGNSVWFLFNGESEEISVSSTRQIKIYFIENEK